MHGLINAGMWSTPLRSILTSPSCPAVSRCCKHKLPARCPNPIAEPTTPPGQTSPEPFLVYNQHSMCSICMDAMDEGAEISPTNNGQGR